jgi:hypothetical protein
VWLGLGGAVVVIAGSWFWTRDLRLNPGGRSTANQTSFVRLTGLGNNPSDQILRERADLLDPTPLFFPTEWNYGQRPLPDRLRRQPGQVFGSFEPKWHFTEQELKLTVGDAAPTPEKPADLLTQGNQSPFAGLGQVDVARQPLAARSGFVEVRGFKDGGKVVIEQTLVGVNVPRADFSPVEFIVVVSPAGVVGEPLLASGSGSDEVDSFFRTYLVKTFRLGERLIPGSYRVFIGP